MIALDVVLLLPVYSYTTCMDITSMNLCTDLAVPVLIVSSFASGGDAARVLLRQGRGLGWRGLEEGADPLPL